MVINAMLFNLVVCFVLPVVLALVVSGKIKADSISYARGKQRGWLVFLLGAAVYLIFEICFRQGVISLLCLSTAGAQWYTAISMDDTHYSLFFGLTAGFAEEFGRVLIFMILYNKFTYRHINKVSAVQYGLGCAWLEAIAVVGYKIVVYFAAALEDVTILSEIGASRTAMAGIERSIFMFYQIGYALLIVNGIRVKRKTVFTIIAFVLHAGFAFTDTYLGLKGMSYTSLNIINSALAAFVCILALILWKIVPVKEKNVYENAD